MLGEKVPPLKLQRALRGTPKLRAACVAVWTSIVSRNENLRSWIRRPSVDPGNQLLKVPGCAKTPASSPEAVRP